MLGPLHGLTERRIDGGYKPPMIIFPQLARKRCSVERRGQSLKQTAERQQITGALQRPDHGHMHVNGSKLGKLFA